ncbi:alpha-L-fucosidase [Flavitalea flava]
MLKAPISSWDEAIPLGNGLMGGLLWGEDNTIRLSLDRGDLWDDRTSGEKEWWKKYTYQKGAEMVAQKKFDEVNNWWDGPYNGVTPTKLPAGRIEIKLPVNQLVKEFELKLATAEGEARLNSGAVIRAIYSAREPVALLLIKGVAPDSVNLLSTLDVYRKNAGGDAGLSSGGSIDKLGYPEALKGRSGHAQWYIQEAAEGLKYCVYVETKQSGNETLLAVSITSTTDAADFLSLARGRCASALNKGYNALRVPHIQWWNAFWQKSSVNVPDTAVQKQYNLVQYFYGAASRLKAPPMPLQGVWTADNGVLPPWKGDYHNDLNTQMTYIAYQEAGRFEEGSSYLDFLWDRRNSFRAFARDFYGTGGLACPGVMSYSGQPLGGWGQYSMSPTMSAWSAHLFYLHWLYTADDHFLQEKAYPWCSAVGECMLGLLKPDAAGLLKLPLSSSPEIFDNSPRAWVEPNSNYDLMCLKMLFLSLKEMATASGKTRDIRKWADAASALGDFHTRADGTLLVDERNELPASHRHLSNLMGLYPFNLVTSEGGGKTGQTINASLHRWDSLGTSQWCGYTFSWMSCLRARIGDAETAIKDLDIFVKAFVLRNGFHANGDQTRSGYSDMTYRPFTLEGNFLASQAVHEMLLQSWSATPGEINTGIIRIFPATPQKWADVSFHDLRAEGGYKVSAVRKNKMTTWFSIEAGKNGTLRIKDNFEGRIPQWNVKHVKKTGDIYEVEVTRGQKVEATLMAENTSLLNKQPSAPKPYGVLPSERQLKWHEMEGYCFLHFTVNTFTDREWGLGDESESVFNPTNFDADQIVSTIAKHGFKGAILTCKHHDGFCLWPSKYTEHSVKNSPWKNGQGDVVKEISAACKKYGIKFGVYLSPWDRNSALYGKPEYITYYRNQLRELLTNYGDIFEVWLDGANGGDGYYGGAKEKREIDRTTYYDWANTWSIIRELQPNACIFSDIGPDARWCGNESGYTNDSCWAPYTAHGPNGDRPGIGNTRSEEGETGTLNGEAWIPAEVDVSIRPGWFYHQNEDSKVRSLKSLQEIYFKSIGNGACWNLNLPPDRTGRINANDIKALDAFQDYLTKSFSKDLLQGAKVQASETRGNSKEYAASNVLASHVPSPKVLSAKEPDKDNLLFWTVNDSTRTASLTFTLPQANTFNCFEIKEYIRLGQRIQSFLIEVDQQGKWMQVFKGTTIGSKKLAKFDNVTASKVRITFLNALACPVIASVRLYKVL